MQHPLFLTFIEYEKLLHWVHWFWWFSDHVLFFLINSKRSIFSLNCNAVVSDLVQHFLKDTWQFHEFFLAGQHCTVMSVKLAGVCLPLRPITSLDHTSKRTPNLRPEKEEDCYLLEIYPPTFFNHRYFRVEKKYWPNVIWSHISILHFSIRSFNISGLYYCSLCLF